MAQAMQLVFVLYFLTSVAGSDHIFKLVNSSVELDVQNKSYNFNILTWLYNAKKIILQKFKDTPGRTNTNYIEKAVFDETTFSLTLNSLQKSDSGLYEAEVSNDEKETVAKYTLQVLDPVEKPFLNVSLQQNNGTCNVILTCEAQSLFVNFTCHNGDCDNADNNKSDFRLLSLYIKNGYIVCNHSNPVSCKNATMEIQHVKKLCSFTGDEKAPMNSGLVEHVLIIVLGVIGGLSIVFIIYRCQKCYRKTGSDNIIYEEIKRGTILQTTEMSEKHETPCTIYCTVGMAALSHSNCESTTTPGSKVDAGK